MHFYDDKVEEVNDLPAQEAYAMYNQELRKHCNDDVTCEFSVQAMSEAELNAQKYDDVYEVKHNAGEPSLNRRTDYDGKLCRRDKHANLIAAAVTACGMFEEGQAWGPGCYWDCVTQLVNTIIDGSNVPDFLKEARWEDHDGIARKFYNCADYEYHPPVIKHRKGELEWDTSKDDDKVTLRLAMWFFSEAGKITKK